MVLYRLHTDPVHIWTAEALPLQMPQSMVTIIQVVVSCSSFCCCLSPTILAKPHWSLWDSHRYCCHAVYVSLVPRPSTPPVFNRLQYAKTEGEGLGNFITWSAARPSNVVTPPLNSQVIYETDLAFCASYKDGASASRELHQAYETYPG